MWDAATVKCHDKQTTQPVFDCSKGTTAASCPPAQCMWEATTNKCHNKQATNPTQPTQPTDHCAQITATADCTPDKMCIFENYLCRKMTTDEAIKKEWEKVLQGSNLPLTAKEIGNDKMKQYFA